MTIHKSQGLTLSNVNLFLGATEHVSGLTYVAMSRVKKIENIKIMDINWERLKELMVAYDSEKLSKKRKETSFAKYMIDQTNSFKFL